MHWPGWSPRSPGSSNPGRRSPQRRPAEVEVLDSRRMGGAWVLGQLWERLEIGRAVRRVAADRLDAPGDHSGSPFAAAHPAGHLPSQPPSISRLRRPLETAARWSSSRPTLTVISLLRLRAGRPRGQAVPAPPAPKPLASGRGPAVKGNHYEEDHRSHRDWLSDAWRCRGHGGHRPCGISRCRQPQHTGDTRYRVGQRSSQFCLHLGKAFTVGVWYQEFSGGSRAYRVVVYSPSGARIFDRRGLGPSAQWAFWTIRTSQAGEYRTVYSGSWTFRATTQARHCQ